MELLMQKQKDKEPTGVDGTLRPHKDAAGLEKSIL